MKHPVFSSQYLLNHAPLHIGQPIIAAAITVGQPFVIESHQVQDGGVQIVDVDSIFDSGGITTIMASPSGWREAACGEASVMGCPGEMD